MKINSSWMFFFTMSIFATRASFKEYLRKHEQGLQQVSFEDLKEKDLKSFL